MDNEQNSTGESPQVFAVERDIDGRWKFRRRDLLVGAALAAAGGALAGCGNNNKKSTYATYTTPVSPLIPTYDPSRRDEICQNTPAQYGQPAKLAVTGDGRTLISMGNDSVVKVWSLPELSWQRSLESTGFPPTTAVAASADGKHFAIGYDFGKIELWSLPDSTLLRTLSISTSQIECLLFAGDQLVAGDTAGEITFWSVETGEQTKDTFERYSYLSALALSPDQSMMASGTILGHISLWSMPDGELLNTVGTENGQEITALTFSGDGTMLVSADVSGQVQFWMLPEGKLLQTVQGHSDKIIFLDTLPALKQVLSTTILDSEIKFWALPEGTQADSWQFVGSNVTALALMPDKEHLIVGSADGTIKLWSLSTREMLTCAIDPQQALNVSDLLIGSRENGETIVLPCGSDLPAGAVCTCNCVSAAAFSVDCGCVGYSATDICSCDRVCTCDTVCSCNSEGSSGGGGGSHYWHPN